MNDKRILLKVQGLNFEIGSFSLKDINLSVNSGDYMVLLGKNGAGKTLFLDCLCGLRKLKSGEIFIGDRDVAGLPPRERNIGYVPQDYALFPKMKVKQNISFGLEIRKINKEVIREKVGRMADLLGISKLLENYPKGLSGGEKQKVALGRALIIEPGMLLLDEPVSALDEPTKMKCCQEFLKIQKETGATILHVCHNIDEALMVAQRVCFFDNGKIVQSGPMDELIKKPVNEVIAGFFRKEKC
ncbi:MAG: ABC transporter ATP-binding protein [Elusimicrobiota bacterium]